MVQVINAVTGETQLVASYSELQQNLVPGWIPISGIDGSPIYQDSDLSKTQTIYLICSVKMTD